jgi:hypothetical protein
MIEQVEALVRSAMNRDGHGVGGDVIRNRKTGDTRTGDRQRIKCVKARRGIAKEQLIFTTEVMIEAEAALVVIIVAGLSRFVDVGADVWKRVELRRLEGRWDSGATAESCCSETADR